MKYCPNCGAELSPGLKYCPSCGAMLPASAIEPLPEKEIFPEGRKSSSADNVFENIHSGNDDFTPGSAGTDDFTSGSTGSDYSSEGAAGGFSAVGAVTDYSSESAAGGFSAGSTGADDSASGSTGSDYSSDSSSETSYSYGSSGTYTSYESSEPVQETRTNGFAIAALVCGIVAVFLDVLLLIPSILAIIFGIMGIRRSAECNSGRGIAIAGVVLGIISIALYIVIFLLLFVFAGVFISF